MGEVAMPYKQRLITVGAILLVCLLLDHGTKWWAVASLREAPGQPWQYLGDIIRIQYAENMGAFLSLGSTLGDGLRLILLVGVNAVILLIVAGALVFKRQISNALVYGLALILAGGVGNLIDRVFRDGIVVDFMNLGLPWGPFPVRTGIFNVADLAIVGGLVLLLAREIFGRPGQDTDREKDGGATDAPS
jgi:signal peptidase II